MIISTVNSIPEDYHYVEAWFIGSEYNNSRIFYLKFKWSTIQLVSCVAGQKKNLFQPLAKYNSRQGILKTGSYHSLEGLNTKSGEKWIH